MNKDEIIKYIKDEIEDDKDTMSWFDDKNNVVRKDFEKSINAHQGLLDLYQKEKEKNKELKKENEKLDEKFKYAVPDEIVDELYISKDKIRQLIKNKAYTDTYNFKTIAVKDILELLEENNEM